MLVRPNFCPAATDLRHLSAVAVHGTAAGTLFEAHRVARHTSEDGRCGREQEQKRDNTSEAAHTSSSIFLRVSGWKMREQEKRLRAGSLFLIQLRLDWSYLELLA